MLIINVTDSIARNQPIYDIGNKLLVESNKGMDIFRLYDRRDRDLSLGDLYTISEAVADGKLVLLQLNTANFQNNIGRILSTIHEVVILKSQALFTKTESLINPIKELYWFGSDKINNLVNEIVYKTSFRKIIECESDAFTIQILQPRSLCKAHSNDLIDKANGIAEIFQKFESAWLRRL